MIKVVCKEKYRIGKTYKSVSFKPKPSRKSRTSSVKWCRRVKVQPSIGKS